jgi:REP element-mobilizing transposase RayT
MSYTHLVYHIVFGTKDRAALIAPAWEHDLYRVLVATVKNHKGELIEINGTADHIHMLVRLLPATAVADFLRELKSVSSKWVRRNHEPKFTWQRRYGAFSVSGSDQREVRDYIRDQKRHHTRRSFDSEYKSILRSHSIEFDERYLWD